LANIIIKDIFVLNYSGKGIPAEKISLQKPSLDKYWN
jgi:hypothetical protein